MIARSGDILTVRGATLARAEGSVFSNDDVQVKLADTTLVTGQGTMGRVYTKNDISVGQVITAIGTLSGNPGSLSLDASRGVVRMLVTTLSGTVNSYTSGSLDLNLQTINGRRVSLFNFAGTGSTPANDANPGHYGVNTGLLILSGLSPGIPVRVRGLVRTFGQAPTDFSAWTVINVADLPAILLFSWQPASLSPFFGSSFTTLAFNTTGVGALHHVLRGGVATDVLPNSPVVQPKNNSWGWYAIGYLGAVQVYTQFADYERALQLRLNLGQKACLLSGQGTFSDAATTLNANAVFMAFQ